jgi:hypothetical protein
MGMIEMAVRRVFTITIRRRIDIYRVNGIGFSEERSHVALEG